MATFLGRRLEYIYAVSTCAAAIPMETTYSRGDAPGGTAMTLRNRGDRRVFANVAAPMVARAMATANRIDLKLLKGDPRAAVEQRT